MTVSEFLQAMFLRDEACLASNEPCGDCAACLYFDRALGGGERQTIRCPGLKNEVGPTLFPEVDW